MSSNRDALNLINFNNLKLILNYYNINLVLRYSNFNKYSTISRKFNI